MPRFNADCKPVEPLQESSQQYATTPLKTMGKVGKVTSLRPNHEKCRMKALILRKPPGFTRV